MSPHRFPLSPLSYNTPFSRPISRRQKHCPLIFFQRFLFLPNPFPPQSFTSAPFNGPFPPPSFPIPCHVTSSDLPFPDTLIFLGGTPVLSLDSFTFPSPSSPFFFPPFPPVLFSWFECAWSILVFFTLPRSPREMRVL